MGPYLGDFKGGATVWFCWDTNNRSGGSAGRTIKGTIKVHCGWGQPAVQVGITDTEDVVTGVHRCEIDLSSDSGYQAGYDYAVVLEGAQIDGQTVNAVLSTFSIENRYASSGLFVKAAKILTNKAVQDKVSGAIEYYDDDGQTVIMTHTPTQSESSITREPS